MSSRLLSPRAEAPPLRDLGERWALIERQRVGRPRRRRPRAWRRPAALAALAFLALSVPAAALAWALTTPRFAVGAVEVRGVSRVAPEEVLAAAAIRPGASLWRIDTAVVAARVAALPGIRRAEVVRGLPDRLTIHVEERRPFTLVHGPRLHWLDEEGRLLGEERRAVASPAPVITGLGEEELATLRTRPGPRVRAAIALIRALLRSGSALAAEISEIDMGWRDGPVLYTLDGIEVRLGTEDWEDRLARLEGVLARMPRPDAVRAIDLRFRDQVVLTKGGDG